MYIENNTIEIDLDNDAVRLFNRVNDQRMDFFSIPIPLFKEYVKLRKETTEKYIMFRFAATELRIPLLEFDRMAAKFHAALRDAENAAS